MDSFSQEELLTLKDIDKSLAVFCLATYGEGDPTDNCMEFYEWIQNNDVDFTGLNYAVSVGKWSMGGGVTGAEPFCMRSHQYNQTSLTFRNDIYFHSSTSLSSVCFVTLS